jgi:phage shock protein C
MNYTSEKHGLYRSRRGLLFGVCRGIAERLDISVFWTRMATVMVFVFTGFWPVGAVYLLLALLLKKEPIAAVKACRTGESPAARRCRRAEGSLDERMHRMQSAMNSDMQYWDARLNGNKP